MQKPEHISDQKALDLIAWLTETHTLLTVSVPHRSYERLTVITQIGVLNDTAAFQIDPPEGLLDLLSAERQGPAVTLFFEFTGADRLPHRFEAVAIADQEQTDFWLRCPQRIERYQLRDNFRIQPPESAELIVPAPSGEIRLAVDNLSLGGALCHCPIELKPHFPLEGSFEGLALLVILDGEHHSVPVDQAVVRRVAKGRRPKQFAVGLEFVAMRRSALQRLTGIIYTIQRKLLRQRFHEKHQA